MTILPIGAIGAAAAARQAPHVAREAAADPGFSSVLGGTIDELQRLQGTADTLAIQAVTGDLDDVHSAMIASTRAQVTLELVAAVRNRSVDAFNEIMRMQA